MMRQKTSDPSGFYESFEKEVGMTCDDFTSTALIKRGDSKTEFFYGFYKLSVSVDDPLWKLEGLERFDLSVLHRHVKSMLKVESTADRVVFIPHDDGVYVEEDSCLTAVYYKNGLIRFMNSSVTVPRDFYYDLQIFIAEL